jgi:hypothetical protein
MEVLNVWALQRQFAVSVTGSELVDILVGVTIALDFRRCKSMVTSWGWRDYM